MALKAYPTESQDIRDHLVLRGFLEKINHSQLRLDLRKQIGDKDVKSETILEQVLHLEALTRIEKAKQIQRVAAIRRDEAKNISGGCHQACQPIVSRWQTARKPTKPILEAK